MTGSRNEFYHLSASKDHTEFVRLSSLFWGQPSGPCAMSHDAWSHEEASATSVWSTGSWCLSRHVPDSSSSGSVSGLLAGTSCYLE